LKSAAGPAILGTDMRHRRAILGAVGAALAAVSLSGCTAFYWSRPGTTPDQFTKDNQDCAKEAAPTPSAVGYGIIIQDVYRACLRARGYVRSKEYQPVSAGFYRGIE
jgi:hypothetical protein